MIELRCPNCNKKAGESPDKNIIFIVICHYCCCKFKYEYGVYSHSAPDDFAKRMKYDKRRSLPYQDRLNLIKK